MDSNQIPVRFYFSIAIDGLEQGFFQEVSGISKELITEDIVDGGENHFKYRLPTSASYKNLVLKRGIFSSTSSLLKWCKGTIDRGLETFVQTKDNDLPIGSEWSGVYEMDI